MENKLLMMLQVDKKQAQTFREYSHEIIILALSGCVCFLFLALSNLNNFIRTDLMQLQIRSNAALENSTNAMKEIVFYQKYEKAKPGK